MENAESEIKEQISESKSELDSTKADLVQELEVYKASMTNVLLSNDSILLAYKQKVAKEKSALKKINQKKLELLEEKNFELKNRINSYVAEDKENWKIFKEQCDKDVNCFFVDMHKLYKFEK